MNNSVSPQNIYIDTSALRGMSFNENIAGLFALSKAGKIRLYISETTLWERGRQQYERDCVGDRVIPFPNEINRYLTWFKMYFEKNRGIVIPTDASIINQMASYIQNDDFYFKQGNENDQRDAHVLATAEVKLEKSTLILCEDINLARAFEKLGFIVRRDFKNFISEVMGNETYIPIVEKPNIGTLDEYQISTTFTEPFRQFMNKADSRFREYQITLPNITDKLNAKLANMQVIDAEIRKRILGYAQWFSPVGKKDLHLLLEQRYYSKDQIESNARRLKQEGLLIETENHWLTNAQNAEVKEICEQAMALVVPEILEILELT